MGKEGVKGLHSFLGDGTVLEGSMKIPHDIRIDGTFKGKLETTETLTVGENGVIEADVIAKSAIVSGKIIGNVSVQDRVELDANAVLKGDLKTRDLVISEGATFQGNCMMNDADGVTV
jgi:cytoskeletal protein CcmA (bactofilin family)